MNIFIVNYYFLFQNFTADFGCISNDSVFSGDKQQLVNEVICQHFFREGLLDIAEEFISVSQVTGVRA